MRSKKIIPYLFIAPFFTAFTLFLIYPIFYGMWISLHEVSLLGKMKFVGLRNYFLLFTNPMFYKSLQVTGSYTLGYCTTHLLLALGAALILNLKFKGRNFFRVAFFLPVITSLAVVGIIWRLILDGHIGLFNVTLRELGFPGKHKWLSNPNLVLFCLIVVGNWRWLGYEMVIFLAGLQNIPQELYEAAKIDGGNSPQIIWYITLPLLFPVIFFALIIMVIGSLQFFAEPYILFSSFGMIVGGPANNALTVSMYLYQSAFQFFKMGYSAALGCILTVIIMAAAYVQIKTLGRKAGLK